MTAKKGLAVMDRQNRPMSFIVPFAYCVCAHCCLSDATECSSALDGTGTSGPEAFSAASPHRTFVLLSPFTPLSGPLIPLHTWENRDFCRHKKAG